MIGWLLLVTMLFFSSLAFTVLENAMSVIFLHRIAVRKRRYVVSAVLPYIYILCLGFGLLIVTLVSGSLQAIGQESIEFLGHEWSLSGLSGVLLYLLGLVGEIFVLSSVYMVMPVGRLSWRHALIGGATAALLWEVTRHVLVWYFSTLSQVNVVYGSLTTAIVVLLSLEIARDPAVAGRPGDLGIRACRLARASGAGQSAANGRSRGLGPEQALASPLAPRPHGADQRGARRIAPSRRITSPLSMSFSKMCRASLA